MVGSIVTWFVVGAAVLIGTFVAPHKGVFEITDHWRVLDNASLT